MVTLGERFISGSGIDSVKRKREDNENVGHDGKCFVVKLYVFGSKDESRLFLLSI